MDIKNIPLNDLHIKLGGKMVPFAGYNMPVRYSSDIEEHMTVRNGVGVFDVSHMGEFTVKGPEALDLIQRVTSNDASKIEKDWNWISKFNTKGAEMKNVSDDICLFAVQGPKAVGVLQKLTKADLSSIIYYHFAVGEFAGVKDVIMSNTGYTGAGGFEIYVNKASAEKVWNA